MGSCDRVTNHPLLQKGEGKKKRNIRITNKENAKRSILANAIIAWDAVMKFEDKDKAKDAFNHIKDNFFETAYIICGMDDISIGEAFVKYISKEGKQ